MTDPSPTRPARTFDELFAEHHLTAEERTKLVRHYESTQDRGDVAVCARPTPRHLPSLSADKRGLGPNSPGHARNARAPMGVWPSILSLSKGPRILDCHDLQHLIKGGNLNQ
jgi:hypothetical protein